MPMDARSTKCYINILNNTDAQIEIVRQHTERISDVMFNLFFNWRRTYSKENVSESDAIAQCILQMMNCKLQSFLKLSEGITIIPKNKSFMILDISTLTTIVRSMYELVFIFHNIYTEQKTEAEKNIVLYLWEIRGLNNRQGLSNVPEKYKEKEENEKKQIEELRGKIREIINELNVLNEVKSQLEKVIKSDSTKIKGYVFEKDINNKIIRFKDIRMEDNVEKLLNLDEYINVYRFCSVHSHPSYLSVLQFGQMYNGDEYKMYLRTLLLTICQLACTMIKDFVENITGAKEIYQKFSDEEKDACRYFMNEI